MSEDSICVIKLLLNYMPFKQNLAISFTYLYRPLIRREIANFGRAQEVISSGGLFDGPSERALFLFFVLFFFLV